jgi:choline dehydrogenase-like flavoprotein
MDRFEVIVVGSGAGGGVIAGELAERGHDVLLLEAGAYHTAADFSRWEAHANRQLFYPLGQALPANGEGPPMDTLRARCVGGGTTINTKVALRAHHTDLEKWDQASGFTGAGGEPVAEADLASYYERMERALDVRTRDDWRPFVNVAERGFEKLGYRLESVESATDFNCMSCGSCIQGCPTNAGKSTMNTFINGALARRTLELRAGCEVTRVVIEDGPDGPEATGVEYRDALGDEHRAEADAVVVACGTLGTPGLLLRSGLVEAAGDSPSARQVGRNLGFHPVRLVFGLFDEVQDAHRAYPITAHCMEFQDDAKGGYVLEASTLMDPIAFAASVCNEDGQPLWGPELTEVMDSYRHWNGVLAMVNDENNGTVLPGPDGADLVTYDWNERERERLDRSFAFAREVLEAAGAKRVLHTNPFSTHLQGSCRMGADPDRSAVDLHHESHDVRRLFVGDGSVVPRTLSVNPMLTFQALALRLADYLASGDHGYFAAAKRAPSAAAASASA